MREMARAWKGGQSTSLLPGWANYSRPIDVDLRYNLPLLRSRAREQSQNNDHVKHFISLLVANVIGPQGITLQAKPRLKSGQPDVRGADAVEAAWLDWQRRGTCDATGTLSWRDVCRIVMACMVRDGEALLRKLPGYGPGGFAVQLIDPETLDLRYNEDRKTTVVRLGVELDAWRRPVAYWLRSEPGANMQSYETSERVRIQASEIVHAYLPEWVWQTRGVPWIATALTRLHHLSEYEEAELVAARAGAEKPGHYKKTMDAGGSVGTDKDLEGQLIDDVRKGEYGILPPGWDFQLDNPTHPTQQFPDFVQAILRGISSGLGVNYNTLSNDLEGVNYTSLRHGALTERAIYMMVQEWYIESVQDVVYRAWLDNALRLGMITSITGATVPYDRLPELRRAHWQARRWAWVDPLKDIQAAKEAITLRTRSVSEIIREQGREPEEVWKELSSDIETMRKLGIEPGEALTAAPKPAPQQTETETPEEDESDGNTEDG